MRYAVIMAGGSGTRLWPMSRRELPKQLIPFIQGRSLLEIALTRLEGLLPKESRYICASRSHETAIQNSPCRLAPERFLGEPCGRDTLNAVGLSAAVIAQRDPEAVIAVFTADHLIEPVGEFRDIVRRGFELVESQPATLVTFGIAPTAPATGYGYLELGEPISGEARRVRQFREKPEETLARQFFAAGPGSYLWNSGMFVWRASTLLDCIRAFHPENFDALVRIGKAWDTPERESVLQNLFPNLKKISVDFAVMEPASRDPRWQVAAIPMPLRWLDVGSWPFFGETCPHDGDGNALGTQRALLVDTRRTLVASSDPNHLITTIGCEDLIVIHTPDATLVCPANRAEAIKDLHRQVGERFGPGMV